MTLSRQGFIDQFAISFGVHCLRRWPKQRTAAPTHLTTCLHEWIGANGGSMAIAAADFARIAAPVIEAMHRTTAKGERPGWEALAGALYDALDQAGVDITLKPFRTATPAGQYPAVVKGDD
ncbi:hypothetical protein SAMN02990966_05939 [Rhodospirillales bacterium URHD0017]|nr:hypothetical protein SAMN02990966_05939 [Rhodospirillales bacterium URHD0017]